MSYAYNELLKESLLAFQISNHSAFYRSAHTVHCSSGHKRTNLTDLWHRSKLHRDCLTFHSVLLHRPTVKSTPCEYESNADVRSFSSNIDLDQPYSIINASSRARVENEPIVTRLVFLSSISYNQAIKSLNKSSELCLPSQLGSSLLVSRSWE